MINKQAVQRFLARKLGSYDWIKDLPDAALDKEIEHLNQTFNIQPFRHQKEMLLIGTSRDEFLFFADLGTGKTAVILWIIQYRKQHNKPHKALICVPNLINLSGWLEQTQSITPDLKCIPLEGSTEHRLELLKEDADLYILNYQGLTRLLTKKVYNKKTKRNEWKYDMDVIPGFASQFDMVVFDESHKLAGWRSQYSKICDKLTDTIPVRYAMTGTPFGRDPQKLWAQFHIIDKGKTFGYTLGIFRAAYFKEKQNYWGGYEYTLLKDKKAVLHNALKNMSLTYTADECQDLPPTVDRKTWVTFDDEAWQYYQRAINTIRMAGGKTDPTSFIRLRQMTSGYVGANVDGDKIEVEFAKKPKLDILMDLVDDISPLSKIIVFHDFIHSGDDISAALTKEKIKHATLWGKTKDKVAQKKKFIDDPNCRVFVVNSAAGGTGLDGLQTVANYVIFYETPVDPITYAQARKRCHRTGQTKKTFFYHILIRNSIDLRIMTFLQQGKNLFDAIIRGEEKL